MVVIVNIVGCKRKMSCMFIISEEESVQIHHMNV
jgi:hypothetical protein